MNLTSTLDLMAFAERLADAARGQTLPRFRKSGAVENKAAKDFDPVTDADRAAERIIRHHIKGTYPDHAVIGEEFGVETSDSAYSWVIDPIDGTRAFVCGVPSWTTLIALQRSGESVIGLIDQPYTDERWIAGPDQHGYVHGDDMTPLATSGCEDLSQARVSTTDPRNCAYFSDDEAAAFARVAGESQVCRFSLDAYAYGLLAIGQLDLVIESGLALHDFAALAPIVTAAGGVVTNWRGGAVSDADGGRIIAAATPALHGAALKLLATAN